MRRSRGIRVCGWCAVVCLLVLVLCATVAQALVLRGQFPINNGMYWNFEDNATQQTQSWVVLGRFNRSGVGPLIILARQGSGFVALKEEWDGLYLYGEYRTDGFTLPETPIMFMPFEIDFDRPLTGSTRMRAYAAGEAAALTGEYDQTVTFSLQALEDITFESREIRNCAVVVKKTEANGTEVIETFWLAPSIGPVKKRTAVGRTTHMQILQSYRTDRGGPPREHALNDYFPLNPGTVFEYRDQSGERVSVTIGLQEEKLGWQTISYAEPDGDVYYLSRDDRGLVFPMKFIAAMGFAFVSLPPDRPPLLLPNIAATGRLNHSLTYLRSTQWPSLAPMLDFYPESETASIVLGVEDVTVPAGTYRECIKLCFSSVTRSFNMQREKIRTGFVWFARGVGEVKREGVSLANAYLEETPDYVFQAQAWELAGIRQADISKTISFEANARPAEEKARDRNLSAEKLVWKDNSKAMFDAAVDAAPFFVRPVVRKNLLDAVLARVDDAGMVEEDTVMAAVTDATPERMRQKLTAELEQMRTR